MSFRFTDRCSGSAPRMMMSAAVLLLVTATVSGCTPAESGPERFQVSGAVTYAGKPVPKGYITFSPDSAQGNQGPGGGAAIENGRYTTLPDKGVTGGPYLVRISGYDGIAVTISGEELPDGQALFNQYETTVEFPRQNTEQDFEVPAAAG